MEDYIAEQEARNVIFTSVTRTMSRTTGVLGHDLLIEMCQTLITNMNQHIQTQTALSMRAVPAMLMRGRREQAAEMAEVAGKCNTEASTALDLMKRQKGVEFEWFWRGMLQAWEFIVQRNGEQLDRFVELNSAHDWFA
jgi:hypothetical protein